jgi:predicted nucleic acid-binding protein
VAQKRREERLVFGDASPLTGLAAAGGFGLLRRLFGVLCVTATVRDEVLAGGDRSGARELQAALGTGWIRVIDDVPEVPAFADLGDGEADTLRAALAAGSDTLVILDDRRARETATAHGIVHVGTLGVIVIAKRRGLIKAARPYFTRLVEHGFRLPGALTKTLLRDLGET